MGKSILIPLFLCFLFFAGCSILSSYSSFETVRGVTKSEMTRSDNVTAHHIHNTEELKIGDLHPLLLHFPIVLFLIVFVFDFLFLIGRVKEPCYSMSHWIVIIAAGMAILTVITGLYASEIHPDNPYVIIHRNWALITLAYSMGHAIFRAYVIKNKRVFSAYLFVLISFINVGLISITAEYGGAVTRGKGLWVHHFDEKHLHQD